MKSWCAIFVLLLVLAIPASSGSVLIYKGTGKQVGKSQGIISGPVNQFILIDPATRQVATIAYYSRNKQKFIFELGPAVYRRVMFTLDTGKSSTVYHQSILLEANTNFANSTRVLRGTVTGLKVSSQSGVLLLHPATLSGVEIFFSDTEDSKVSSELRYNVTFQQKRTIEANDANQTIQQVFNSLIDELAEKGFE